MLDAERIFNELAGGVLTVPGTAVARVHELAASMGWSPMGATADDDAPDDERRGVDGKRVNPPPPSHRCGARPPSPSWSMTAPWWRCRPAVCIGVWGRNAGKALLRCRIVSADGGRATWGQAAIRSFSSLVILGLVGLLAESVAAAPGARGVASTVLVIAAYGMALFDPRRRTLFDRPAGTMVVCENSDVMTAAIRANPIVTGR